MEESALALEVLVILFRAFPGQFVLVGGGALHWIFKSPRLSADLDLKPVGRVKENLLPKMVEVLNQKIPAVALSLGMSLSCQLKEEAQAIQIFADNRPVLRVELVPM